jgi:hypothetical protein
LLIGAKQSIFGQFCFPVLRSAQGNMTHKKQKQPNLNSNTMGWDARGHVEVRNCKQEFEEERGKGPNTIRAHEKKKGR